MAFMVSSMPRDSTGRNCMRQRDISVWVHHWKNASTQWHFFGTIKKKSMISNLGGDAKRSTFRKVRDCEGAACLSLVQPKEILQQRHPDFTLRHLTIITCHFLKWNSKKHLTNGCLIHFLEACRACCRYQ